MPDCQRKPLALGILGGSLQSAVGRAHYCAATMDGLWQVQAGCFSRNAASNGATAEAFGVAPQRAYADWQAMVVAEKSRLDAVAILTPTPAHAGMAAFCLEQGVPVICEKALAATAGQARRLGALRAARGGFLAVTYNYTGYPMVRELRQLVRSGALGRIVHFQIEMPQEGFIRTDGQGRKPTPQEWRLHDGQVPTLYLDLAVHLHHLLHYLTGALPVRVAAEQGSHGWFSDVVDNVSCLCRCSDDSYGHVWFSKSALGYRNGLRLRLFGTRAAAEWVQANPEELLLSHESGRREILDRGGQAPVAAASRTSRFKPGHPAGFTEAFANVYADIAEWLRRWQATGEFNAIEIASAEIAAQGLDFLNALHVSAHSGQWRMVDEGRFDAAA